MRRLIRPALSGLLAAAGGIATAELVASLVRPESSPLVAIGGTVIDATPTPVKEYAVSTFGTNDKPLLIGTILVVLAALAAAVGVLAVRHRTAALLAIGALGLVGAAAALARPGARPLDALPSLLAGAVSAVLLAWLAPKAVTAPPPPSPVPAPDSAAGTAATKPWTPSDPGAHAGAATPQHPEAATATPPGPETTAAPGRTGRRSFLVAAGLVALGTALAGGLAAIIRRSGAQAADEARGAITLPAPADPGPPPEQTPGFYTPNQDFYRVDIALTVPRIDPRQWSLQITGMVDRPVELSFDDLLKQPLIERDITLNCVSNEVGGPYVGNARWLGVPLAPLLRAAGVQAGADQIVARAADGITIGTPVATVLDGRDAMLALGMNGQALPLEHGFPVRMLTPGLYGYVGAAKWITSLELSTFSSFDAYWVQRGWAQMGPVKTASRIDRPKAFAQLPAGTVTVAGVAWAQHRGISAVEVQVDDAPWQQARLLPVPSTDTWVQWVWDWPATTAGNHTLRVRAVDSTGAVQAEQRADPFPDGATGWQTLAVTVT
ncbi:molybdopterin-dependent oxidoreductase [Catellatospora chokoriensis]|uniref:Oxidoreductase n=1 Tax=Catellatospora chokoriensis TaxID=310353 RepID=A0A8J3NSN8_9ACTN|nr:molybdopterin-dependent oxidoreductase [Catellatospora chokoriensis]GIF91210.1 oxidoreductase [Catellatospora chokoriensis]